MENKTILSLKNYTLKNDNRVLVQNLNLNLQKGKCIGLSGPTGSGKTTLLKLIFIMLKNDNSISFVFQDNCLLNEKSVKKNVCIPLENKYSKTEAETLCNQWLDTLDIQKIADKKAGAISGGEAQRTNIARALAWNGQVFLLDEPFSAQDDNHKKIVVQQIEKLKETEHAILLVSHNNDDLQYLCDEIITLK